MKVSEHRQQHQQHPRFSKSSTSKYADPYAYAYAYVPSEDSGAREDHSPVAPTDSKSFPATAATAQRRHSDVHRSEAASGDGPRDNHHPALLPPAADFAPVLSAASAERRAASPPSPHPATAWPPFHGDAYAGASSTSAHPIFKAADLPLPVSTPPSSATCTASRTLFPAASVASSSNPNPMQTLSSAHLQSPTTAALVGATDPPTSRYLRSAGTLTEGKRERSATATMSEPPLRHGHHCHSFDDPGVLHASIVSPRR